VLPVSFVIRKASEKDLLPIQRLLAKAGLQEGAMEDHLKDFLVVENENHQVIGTVGVECFGKEGLLRSLVIDAPNWTSYRSLEFLQVALAHAKEKGVETVYLCAKQASELFAILGFKQMDQDQLPESIKTSSHFRQTAAKEIAVFSCQL
jgi:N-acetylglutamate synthase-like GNAT family acetyltransferase